MGFIRKEILIGFLVSTLATAFGLFLYTQYISNENFIDTIKSIKQGGVLGTVIAISAIPNLFVFFVFLKKKQDYRARGVLLATIVTAIITFILRVTG